jgi:hypothetical protein
MVAFKTTGYDVIPSFAATPYHGDDVIESQVLRGAFGPAVLASVNVAGIDVGPAELYVPEPLAHPDIF